MSESSSTHLNSMTGFASVRGRVGPKRFLLEAKSVNHRFCEVNVRLPGRYAAWELLIQKEVKAAFQRGRIDIFIKEESGEGMDQADMQQIRRAHRELKRLTRELKLSDALSVETVLNFRQNFLRDDNSFNAANEWNKFRPLLSKMVKQLRTMRAKEGKQLARWFRIQLPQMKRLLDGVRKRVKLQPKRFRDRITKRLDELGLKNGDSSDRLVAEVALLSDRLDVTEELVRLDAHMKAFRSLLKEKGAIGRKMDFLMQEFGREINTIASKSQDTDISRLAVQFKTEVEKIREQAGNVE